MVLLQKILLRLNGLHYRQEYLCCCTQQLLHAPKLYWCNGRRIINEITANHVFAGYHPLIFVLPAFSNAALPEHLHIVLTQRSLSPNEELPEKDALATLQLQRIHQQELNGQLFYYYKGIQGRHRFISAFHRQVNHFINTHYQNKTGNVYLHTDLYHQVQTAYAVPRTIALITVSDGTAYNVFPTDLHGKLNEDTYIISLRTGGMALQQVQETRQLLLSFINVNHYRMVYALGKNHMQPMKEKAAFEFTDSTSNQLHYPLPVGTEAYCELQLMDSFEEGIHTLLHFKVAGYHQLAPLQTLAHIHNTYATWRYKNGLPGNYLLR